MKRKFLIFQYLLESIFAGKLANDVRKISSVDQNFLDSSHKK